MEIIDELEPVSRGPYCGAIGYLGFNRESQLSITIRTAVCKDGLAHFNVGAGIVADSSPGAEYEETLAKARGFLAALENGGRSLPHLTKRRANFHRQSLRPGSQTIQFLKTK
jgi:para-aminobenzoate synthetase component 1